ncbi:MAG: glycosyltransferase family 2 protein, partial [Acidobacteria bacterium]|nr:glycosyltransferase family 2 protein [Acidobacteriota bacterium]
MPRISVVIPTHNRCSTLRCALRSLANQSLGSAEYEVIVVADGCDDDTIVAAGEFKPKLSLTCIEQSWAGRAAARNSGALASDAPLLLFLDDDMEAGRTLLTAHLEAHAAQPGGVVLGYFPVAGRREETAIAGAVALWWDRVFAALADPHHRFTYKDFYTGNLSLSRELFIDIGGFEERIGPGAAGEDWELGLRLMKRGVALRFVREAYSRHNCGYSEEDALRRAREEGYGQALIASWYPETFSDFRLGRLQRICWPGPLWEVLWRHPGPAALAARHLQVLREIAERCQWDRAMWRIHNCLCVGIT